jgi:DNA-binding LacI/PurR family transcriptional regulator
LAQILQNYYKEREMDVLVTLKEIAQRVGVSISTVSRVINNDKSRSVNEETWKRIWDVVHELGYEPNKAAQRLVKGDIEQNQQTFLIGCIIGFSEGKYNNPYFSHILDGIEKGLSDQGYRLAYLHTANEFKDPMMLYKTIQETKVDGVIFVEGTSNEIYEYIKSRVKYVVGIDISDTEVPRIGYDRISAAKFAVKHLLEQGHSKIGYIGGPGLSGQMSREKRFRGYKEALEEAGIEVNPSWVLNTNWDIDESYQLMNKLLELPDNDKPTAMFAGGDMLALSAMRSVNEKGLKIPEDIAFVGIDNIDFSQHTSPPLTTIHIPKHEIGYIAALTMIDYIQERYSIPVKILVPFELKVRQSSAART